MGERYIRLMEQVASLGLEGERVVDTIKDTLRVMGLEALPHIPEDDKRLTVIEVTEEGADLFLDLGLVLEVRGVYDVTRPVLRFSDGRLYTMQRIAVTEGVWRTVDSIERELDDSEYLRFGPSFVEQLEVFTAGLSGKG